MANLFELPPMPIPKAKYACWLNEYRCEFLPAFTADQMQSYARAAQTDLISRLAQMQEHEAIEWLLKARQDWWKS